MTRLTTTTQQCSLTEPPIGDCEMDTDEFRLRLERRHGHRPRRAHQGAQPSGHWLDRTPMNVV